MVTDVPDFRDRFSAIRDDMLGAIPRAHIFRDWYNDSILHTLCRTADDLRRQGLEVPNVPESAESVRLSLRDPPDSVQDGRVRKRIQKWTYDWLQARVPDRGPARLRLRVERRWLDRLSAPPPGYGHAPSVTS